MGAIGFNTSGQFTLYGRAVDYGKNYIINGGFDYWNYATSQSTSGYGSADRWNNVHLGSTKTITKQFSELLSASVMRTVVTSVAGANNYVRNIQRIENIAKYAGRTITLSFQGQVNTNKNIAISFSSVYGTGGTPSAQEDYGMTIVPITTAFGKKTVTVTVPSIVGKTIGTDGSHTSYLQVQFWFDAGSGTLASSLGQQSGTFDIAEVKLEEGSVATPWTPYEGEFGGEIQACQRYLPVCSANWTIGQCYGATSLYVVLEYKTITRVPPTGLSTVVSGFALASNATTINLTAITFADAGVESARISMTVASGLVAGNITLVKSGNIYLTGCEL